MAEALGVKMARLEEKLEHLIRTHEDSNRERRDAHAKFEAKMKSLDDRLGNVEKVVLKADVSWRTLVKLGSVIGLVVGAFYSILHAIGIKLTIQ